MSELTSPVVPHAPMSLTKCLAPFARALFHLNVLSVSDLNWTISSSEAKSKLKSSLLSLKKFVGSDLKSLMLLKNSKSRVSASY